MEDLKNMINEIILKIIKQRSQQVISVSQSHNLIADLGFGSMDIAQLVATLELKFNVDPFSKQISIADVRTVEDLFNAYQSCLNEK